MFVEQELTHDCGVEDVCGACTITVLAMSTPSLWLFPRAVGSEEDVIAVICLAVARVTGQHTRVHSVLSSLVLPAARQAIQAISRAR